MILSDLVVRIKKLNQAAIVPSYAKDGDAAMDVTAVSMQESGRYIEYGTGLAFEVPAGYVLLVVPRSSSSDMDLIFANSIGVLDSGFRGELKLRFRRTGERIYEIGDRIGQVMILPYPRVNFEVADELSSTARGQGGFGSTGQ